MLVDILPQIDAIDFAFVVTKFTSEEDLVDGPPEDGCYVRGLFIGAQRHSFSIYPFILRTSS